MAEEIYINTGGSFQQPYNARTPGNAQTTAQGRTPFTYIAQGRSPFTYQNRSPFTYIAQGQAQNPYIANAQQPYAYQANAQTPYIANAQQPYPYIANAQQPYIANAQQAYPYIANGQQPYIANARQPYPYQASAQQPYIANARQPFIYQAPGNYRTPYPFSFQNPFTYARQGTAPYPFIANGRTPVIVQQPYTFSARRPAVGRVPYIYAGDTSVVGSLGFEYYDYSAVSSGSTSSTCSVIVYAFYSDTTTIELRYVVQAAEDGGWHNTSNVYQDPTAGPDIPTNGIAYYIDDVSSGYAVKYTVNSIGGDSSGYVIDSYSTSPATASMTTTAQTISTTVKRGVRFRSYATSGDGDYTDAHNIFNVTFTFTKSGETTFSKTLIMDLSATAESYGGQ
jgi:hypothetical protein